MGETGEDYRFALCLSVTLFAVILAVFLALHIIPINLIAIDMKNFQLAINSFILLNLVPPHG